VSVMQSVMETVARFLSDSPPDPLLQQHAYVGRSLDRVDADAKVRGEAHFTAEFKVAGLTYAVLVHGTIAKGSVSEIHTESAEKAPGVLVIITHRNMPRIKTPPIVDFNNIGKGFALSDLPIMQDTAVHWDGEPVAVVVADTLERAEYAASLVRVEYDVATPNVSFQGMKDEAVVPPNVLGEPSEIKIGDPDTAQREADAVVSHIYRAPRYNHNAIEPHATIAVWNDGQPAVFDSTQSVDLTAIHSPTSSISKRKTCGWSRPLSAAVSAARSACGITRRFARQRQR
jgi:xanthine dehydrogenase YagR molybdenum-binding subunit